MYVVVQVGGCLDACRSLPLGTWGSLGLPLLMEVAAVGEPGTLDHTQLPRLGAEAHGAHLQCSRLRPPQWSHGPHAQPASTAPAEWVEHVYGPMPR